MNTRAYPAFSFLLFLIIGIFNSSGQTITIGSLAPLPPSYCAGQTVAINFTATGFGSGVTFTAWLSDSSGNFSNATNISSGSDTTSPITATIPNSVPTGTGYLIRVRSSTNVPGTFNSPLTINTIVAPSIAIVSGVANNTLCAGTNVTFTATPSNGGTSPTYQWKKNGDDVGIGSTNYSSSTLANGDTITCTLNRGDNCASPGSITSSPIIMTVIQIVTPTISITPSPNDTICSGTVVTFTPDTTNGGASPTYQWKKNGALVGNNSRIYNDSSLVNGDTVTCTLISSAQCPSQDSITSNQIGMTVIPTVTPAIRITASPSDTICSGTAVAFTPDTTNGGASPTYQWKKNGNNVGTGSAYSDNTLADGDTITCIFTSTAACATQATVISPFLVMNVNPLPPASFKTPSHAICENSLGVVFSADVVTPGATYLWSALPPLEIKDSSSSNVSIDFLTDADSVFVTLKITDTSSCSNSYSDAIPVSNSGIPDGVRIEQLGSGTLVCVYTDDVNSYQWGYDWRDESNVLQSSGALPGDTFQSFIPNAGIFTDSFYYWVKVVFQNGCVTRVYFNKPVGLGSPLFQRGSFSVYPNPSDGLFMISLDDFAGRRVKTIITGITGKIVFLNEIQVENRHEELTVSRYAMPDGLYILTIQSAGAMAESFKLAIAK